MGRSRRPDLGFFHADDLGTLQVVLNFLLAADPCLCADCRRGRVLGLRRGDDSGDARPSTGLPERSAYSPT
jgi:hypothetical protein